MLAFVVWQTEQARSAVSSYVLYGAGAVGGVIGGRLSLAGHDVTLVARGEHLARILADGLVLDTAEGRHAVRAPATDTAAGIEWRDDTVVVLAVKSHQTEAALADLVRHAPGDRAGGLRAERRHQRAGHAAPVRPHLRDHGDAARRSTSSRASSSRAATRCRASSTSAATRPAPTR